MTISTLPKIVGVMLTVMIAGYAFTQTRAGTVDMNNGTMADSKGPIVDLGTGKFASFPFHATVSVRGGYDDNVFSTSTDKQGSLFSNASLALSYNFGSPRTQLSLITGAGVNYYFDRGDSDPYDLNAFLGLNIVHKATPRLTLTASLYATYQAQPDFTAFNAGLGLTNQSRNFFYTTDKFSVAYLWAPRFSTVTSYTFGAVNYDDNVIGSFEDRFEHTFGNEFRFLLTPTTTLVGEYRFALIDYIDNDARDSTAHFFLAGVDHTFSPRFNVSLRAGAEVRNYNGDGTLTSPYAESTLNYALGSKTSLSWTSRYGIEEPDVPEALSRRTFRTGLYVRHSFTPRISSTLTLAYQHDENDGNGALPGFSEDAFDLGLNVRYAITRNFAADLGYQHTEVISDAALFRAYSRNRYYAGLSFSF